ncbi:MAG: hypothetical protein K2L15_04185, partial [Eubacteriales bacterium]|nr:hypothetical protein [Eubacteriales bacterium]
DNLLYLFLIELTEMVTLYKNNTIKKPLFDLWIEDKKREYTEKEREKNKEQETKEQETKEQGTEEN